MKPKSLKASPNALNNYFRLNKYSISNVIIYLVDSGKEALKMARMRLPRLVTLCAPPRGFVVGKKNSSKKELHFTGFLIIINI
jgi:hypothetical protein